MNGAERNHMHKWENNIRIDLQEVGFSPDKLDRISLGGEFLLTCHETFGGSINHRINYSPLKWVGGINTSCV